MIPHDYVNIDTRAHTHSRLAPMLSRLLHDIAGAVVLVACLLALGIFVCLL